MVIIFINLSVEVTAYFFFLKLYIDILCVEFLMKLMKLLGLSSYLIWHFANKWSKNNNFCNQNYNFKKAVSG